MIGGLQCLIEGARALPARPHADPHNNTADNVNQDALCVVDLAVVRAQLARWRRELKRVDPWYAVKCNPDNGIMRELALAGCGFDVASSLEIDKALALGVTPQRIVYANPCKGLAHLKHAAAKGIQLTTFDNSDELRKIHAALPNARLVVRILGDDSSSVCRFNAKFGIAVDELAPLLREAAKIGANVAGVSFHVGSGCRSADAFAGAVKNARAAFDMFEECGLAAPSFLDLGGGWPGALPGQEAKDEIGFEAICAELRPVLDALFPVSSGVQIIAEPGRFFAHASSMVVAQVTARRAVKVQNAMPPLMLSAGSSHEGDGDSSSSDDEDLKRMRRETMPPGYRYYINDGCYGSFNCIMYDHRVNVEPQQVLDCKGKPVRTSGPLLDCSIWGGTCDGIDCITMSCPLPEIDIGSWLVFKNMGAYTIAATSHFNGFAPPRVVRLNASD